MEKIDLFIMNLTLTTKCTLKCKLCVADIMKYENREHFSFEYLSDSLKQAFSIVDHVERMQLSGGEPLMHPQIAEIIDMTMQYQDKFDNLGMFFNGTIPLSEHLLETLEKYDKSKFMFYISNYGEHSPKADLTASQLTEHGFKVSVKKYYGEDQHMNGWVDYGDYERFEYSKEELKDLFQNCGVCQMGGIWSVRFGEIHRCTRSASGMSLGKIPKIKEDYIDLFDTEMSVEEQKEKMIRLMKKEYITACEYCPGDFGTDDITKRFPAGEQMTV